MKTNQRAGQNYRVEGYQKIAMNKETSDSTCTKQYELGRLRESFSSPIRFHPRSSASCNSSRKDSRSGTSGTLKGKGMSNGGICKAAQNIFLCFRQSLKLVLSSVALSVTVQESFCSPPPQPQKATWAKGPFSVVLSVLCARQSSTSVRSYWFFLP